MSPSSGEYKASSIQGHQIGVYEKMEDAIEAAKKANQHYSQYSIKDRQRFIDGIKKWTLKENTT